MRQKIVAGNWKMNNNLAQAQSLTSELVQMLNDEHRGESHAVLCVPYVYLGAVGALLKGSSKISLGAQNCSDKESGAYTGEISAGMLVSLACKYVIVGHSERRMYYHETDALVSLKAKAVLDAGLTPIVCCGESQQIRESGEYIEFVGKQLIDSLAGLSAEQVSKIVVAYEPVWAIGTGLSASAAQAEDMHLALRQQLGRTYSVEIADQIAILYGGSLKASSAPELFSCPNVDGGLVGGASLVSREFANIVLAAG